MSGIGRLKRRRLLRDVAAFGALAAAGPFVASCAPVAAPSPSLTSQPTATPLPSPETTTIRLPAQSAACDPYFWMGDDLLREEGFTQIERAKPDGTIVNGGQDLEVVFAPALPAWVDEGRPVVVLAGTHVGCIQAWATPEIRSLRDLRGKRVPVAGKGLNVFFNWWVSMLTSVGLDPAEVNFVVGQYDDTIFTDGKVDAILVSTWGGPLLARNTKNPGRKLVDTSFDKPWSQHFCCLLVANREWAQRYPVAARRATRAILRAQDLAAKDTTSAMQVAIDKKLFPPRVTLDVLLEFMKVMPMNWREYDPEDTVRYYALRLADAKLLKRSPQQIVADGIDVAYFKQLRKELRP